MTLTIGERIKQRRKELDLSVEDVATKLNKNKATIYRYESNEIENLPITILEPLAEALQTTPAYLMGWDIGIKEIPIKYIDISKEEHLILSNFSKLNDLGKNEANKRVAELTEIAKYSYNDESYIPTTFAAHDDSDPEIAKHDADVARKFLSKIKKK